MPAQILLCSQSRSGSHLLERMLSHQNTVHFVDHLFSSGRLTQLEWLQSEKLEDGMASDARAFYDGENQKGVEQWKGALEEAQSKDQTLMLHFHPFFPVPPEKILDYINHANHKTAPAYPENFSMVPDSLLLTPGTVPILNIRHPKLVVPSTWRTLNKMGLPHGAGRPNFLIVTSHIWSRALYDFFLSKGIEPLVVDADDFMTSEEFVRHLCSKAGLDPDQAYFSWPMDGDKDKHHPMYYASQSTLLNSAGPDAALAAKNKDLAKEEAGWAAEFGDDLALVQEMVDLAMPHYEYLYERRLRL